MLLQIIISGLLLGGVYAIIGLGFSIVSGVMKILNFSHGALIMLGAYSTFMLTRVLGIDALLTLPITMGILFVVGVIVQKLVINRIVKAPTFMTLILTFGLDMVFVNLAMLIWTPNLRSIVTPYTGVSIDIFSAKVSVVRLIVFALAILITIGLYFFMNKTTFGKAINATRMDLDAAQLNGIDISWIYCFTFGIGAALAGAAGALIAIIMPFSPTLGTLFSAKAFAICILGGFGNMAGPLLGGILMGIMETAGVSFLGSGYQDAIPFGVMLFILIFKPKGILGKEYY